MEEKMRLFEFEEIIPDGNKQTLLEPVKEEAPPGMEDWILKNKERFKRKYGKDYAKFLYGHAWNMHNKEK